jgi:hypothetical protein
LTESVTNMLSYMRETDVDCPDDPEPDVLHRDDLYATSAAAKAAEGDPTAVAYSWCCVSVCPRCVCLTAGVCS